MSASSFSGFWQGGAWMRQRLRCARSLEGQWSVDEQGCRAQWKQCSVGSEEPWQGSDGFLQFLLSGSHNLFPLVPPASLIILKWTSLYLNPSLIEVPRLLFSGSWWDTGRYTYSNPFNLYTSVREVQSLFLFYRWENWEAEEESHLPILRQGNCWYNVGNV